MAEVLTARALAEARADTGTATVLVVPAMHCGGCLKTVERVLNAQIGVTAARANLSTKRVTVLHDDRAGIAELAAALKGAGFEATELMADDGAADSRRDQDYMMRLAVAGFAAANIMLLSVAVWAGFGHDMDASVAGIFHWLSAAIAIPAVAFAGQPFFRSAAQALKARRLNMDVPISLGVLLATGMSMYQTARGSEQVYFDAAVALLFFLLIGRFLDTRMRMRAAGAAQNLLGLTASLATVVQNDGTTMRVSARALVPGMRLLVAAGERVAADGVVVSSATALDESLITGETAPRRVNPGDHVFAGTLNVGEAVEIEAKATDESTLVAEIRRLMEAAEQGRGHYVRLADRAARIYAPAVHLLSLSTFIGWLIAGVGWEHALTVAISVLIITCPCALALAVPAVQVAATSRLLERGVIVKAADALERLAGIDTVVLDKTGTLTTGEITLAQGFTPDRAVLARAAALGAASRHPYAQAAVRAAAANAIPFVPAADVRETPGLGLAAGPQGREERLGSAAWCGAADDAASASSLYYRDADGRCHALPMADRLRPDAAATVAALRAAGLAVELLSGDRAAPVAAAARAAGIDNWRAEQRPNDKIARLAALKDAGHRVLMIGDGLNDAPALAAGYASLSPSTAADIAQNAADAIFQGERLSPVIDAIAVARASTRMAVQNFAIAVGYNAVFVPLAALGFVTPLIAAVAMSSSSILVTANAIRLKGKRVVLS